MLWQKKVRKSGQRMQGKMARAKVVPIRADQEYGSVPGETPSERCARLGNELGGVRLDVAARGEPTDRQPPPQLDDRLPGLLLDALAPVEAAIGSAFTGLPYSTLRACAGTDEDSRRELLCATQAMVAAHPDFFVEHRSAIELFVPLMAISAAQLDQLLMFVDAEQARSGLPMQPFSAGQALMTALVVLMPVLLPLAGFVLFRLIRKG